MTWFQSVTGMFSGRAILWGAPGGSPRSRFRFSGVRSWAPTVAMAVSITSWRRRPLIQLLPISRRSREVGWTSTTLVPASRSRRASLPRRRPRPARARARAGAGA